MAESSSRTLVCSVLFAELEGYAHLPVGEQERRKRLLKAMVAQEVVQVPMAEQVLTKTKTGNGMRNLKRRQPPRHRSTRSLHR